MVEICFGISMKFKVCLFLLSFDPKLVDPNTGPFFEPVNILFVFFNWFVTWFRLCIFFGVLLRFFPHYHDFLIKAILQKFLFLFLQVQDSRSCAQLGVFCALGDWPLMRVYFTMLSISEPDLGLIFWHSLAPRINITEHLDFERGRFRIDIQKLFFDDALQHLLLTTLSNFIYPLIC